MIAWARELYYIALPLALPYRAGRTEIPYVLYKHLTCKCVSSFFPPTLASLENSVVIIHWSSPVVDEPRDERGLFDSRALLSNHATDFWDVGLYPIARFHRSIGFYSDSGNLPNTSKPTTSTGKHNKCVYQTIDKGLDTRARWWGWCLTSIKAQRMSTCYCCLTLVIIQLYTADMCILVFVIALNCTPV